MIIFIISINKIIIMIESLNELRNNQTLRHSITARDYLFGLLLALDIKKAEAYRLVYNINN